MPSASIADDADIEAWMSTLNGLVARMRSRPASISKSDPNAPFWLAGESLVMLVRTPGAARASNTEGVVFSSRVAQMVAERGLPADAIREIGEAAQVDMAVLGSFIGLNRTTIKRRADRNEPLPSEVSAKALEFAELVTVGAEVFGSVEAATRWLTRPHPSLDGATPLEQAKTRWGFERVRSLLAAVRYGSAA